MVPHTGLEPEHQLSDAQWRSCAVFGSRNLVHAVSLAATASKPGFEKPLLAELDLAWLGGWLDHEWCKSALDCSMHWLPNRSAWQAGSHQCRRTRIFYSVIKIGTVSALPRAF